MTLEGHLAHYIVTHNKADANKGYRQECLAHWRQFYGDKVTLLIKREVEKEWAAKKLPGVPFRPEVFN
jgi:hypothetical protein